MLTGASWGLYEEASWVSQARSYLMSVTAEATAIRPFHVDIPEEALEDLRRRIVATQWPEKETVPDDSQGVPLATM